MEPVDGYFACFAVAGPLGIYFALRPSPTPQWLPDWLRRDPRRPSILDRLGLGFIGLVCVTVSAKYFASRLLDAIPFLSGLSW